MSHVSSSLERATRWHAWRYRLGAVCLVLLTACGGTSTAPNGQPSASSTAAAGSTEAGVTTNDGAAASPVTRTYDLSDVRAIDVSSAFTLDVTIADETTVTVTTTEALIDDVEVEVRDGLLLLSLTSQRPTGALLQAVVTIPSLERLSAAGATDVFVSDIDETTLVVDIEGASDVAISGRAETAQIEVTGASDADLGDLAIIEAVVSIDGASDVDLGEATSVSGSVTGAATLIVGAATSTALDISGAATVERN